MYSMKRTSASCDLPNSIRSASSSSLKPRTTTVLSLRCRNPTWRAAWIPATTSSWRLVFPDARHRAGGSGSRGTLPPGRPPPPRASPAPGSARPVGEAGGPRAGGGSGGGGGAARRALQGLRPVARDLLLPPGQAALHSLDRVAPALECLRPGRRGGEDGNARLAHGPVPEPVPQGDA